MPRISVVMPVYNGEKYISEAIETILTQTFEDFEFIIINEHGSNEKSTSIITRYSKEDSRIRIIQNTERLGLAKSLNIGIDAATGEYIARADADDSYFPERFEKQITYLDANPDIFLCGSLQRTLSPHGLTYEELPTNPEELKAALMFSCEIHHAAVMMRRLPLIENGWWYTDDYLPEDYDLWTKILHKAKMVNFPEVLVTRRWGFVQRSIDFGYDAQVDVCKISKQAISKLGIDMEKYNPAFVLGGFRSLPWKHGKISSYELLDQNYRFLCEIEDINKVNKMFDETSLHNVLVRRWVKWVIPVVDESSNNYFAPRFSLESTASTPVKAVIQEETKIKKRINLSSAKNIFKKLLRIVYKPFFDKINAIIRDEMKVVIQKIDNIRIPSLSNQPETPYIPYQPGEKIRIVFLYQMPSFWPSWDTLLDALYKHSEAEICVVLFDINFQETSQTVGAREFLQQLGVTFIDLDEFNFNVFNPHIVVYQTPYDGWHRPPYLHAHVMKKRGFRVAYITYGIEITKTPKSEGDQFRNGVVSNAWRIYTFSSKMKKDYMRYFPPHIVKALGHPKFDKLYDVRSIKRCEDAISLAGNRKIILWKMHFPYEQNKNGKPFLVTPDLHEYLKFAEKIEQFTDLFFIVMMHPKFLFESRRATIPGIEEASYELVRKVKLANNVYFFEEQDYRPAIIVADGFIIDRSAIMIEAGVLEKPILYMSSKDEYEPPNQAVESIVLSYYQGTTLNDIERFIEMFCKGQDPKKTERLTAIKEGIPFFDGNSGKRIAQDLIDGVKNEPNHN